MLIRTLLAALNRAETPRTANAIAKLLEIRTGERTNALIDRLERKSVVIQEQPAIIGTPDNPDWYARHGYYGIAGMMGGAGSYTGHMITPDAALQASVVYACTKIIAEDMGSLPLFPFERSQDQQTIRKAYGHPSYRVVHDQPNPDMSAGEFREALTARACLGLDGLARIERMRTDSGRFVMWPILYGLAGDPQQVRIERNANGQRIYYVREGSGPEQSYDQAQIFHLRGFTFTGVDGDPVLARARHVLGLTLAGQEYAARWYGQGSFPSVAITMPPEAGTQGEDQILKIKKAWMNWHQGLPRVGTPAVIQAGGKVELLSPDLQKQQALESRKYQVLEVARLYRMPLQKLLDLERMTFNNTEQMAIQYVQEVIGNWGRRWEEALERTLLTEDDRYWESGAPRMYFEHEYRKLLQGDFKAQTEGWRAMLEKGVFSINEVRKLLNLNPIEGGDGHYIQLNMQNVADAAQQILDTVTGGRATGEQKTWFVDLLKKALLNPAEAKSDAVPPLAAILDATTAVVEQGLRPMADQVAAIARKQAEPRPEPPPAAPIHVNVAATIPAPKPMRKVVHRDAQGRVDYVEDEPIGPRSIQ